ncbi:MAG: sigma 54-interacting transcriptional regulator [Deltaproteobacteria bacterium]|jgi:transcriptional regulator with PAS, ATPase and Fis domain|nr:sigma 54-interacting transcriptional regulator [Deltaproteobacteria bacterium]
MKIRDQGKKILKWSRDFLGKPLHTQFGAKIDIDQVYQSRKGFTDREFFIKQANKNIQLMVTANPIFNLKNQIQGIIIIFNEINRIRRLVNHIAGSQARFKFEDITGISPSIEKAKQLAMVAASSTSTVLITGKTGTGKELFAQAIHNKSKRQKYPFLTINCSAIPKELIESELFGYAEGAFTGARKGGRPGKFELANGGTVLLDEIGDMPLNMQTKLLRVLQTRRIYRIGEHKPIEVDIRIIAATHVNLKNAVSHGNFREDLFYRLNVFPIKIPSLKNRIEDILLLANNILNRTSNAMDKPYLSFSADSENSLLKHDWHGNVRELENVVERAINVVEGKIIEPMHMGLINTRKHQPVSILNQKLLLKKVEMETIAETLEAVGYNISRASKILGISRATLYKKIDRYHLSISKSTE